MSGKVGDAGQRYEHWCDGSDGPLLLGWSADSEKPFKAAVEAHPEWSAHRSVDRTQTEEIQDGA